MTYSQEKPLRWEKLGQSLWRFNYAVTVNDDGFSFKSVIFDHLPTISEIINEIIKDAFPAGEENAIQRKGILNPSCDEFINYNTFVEDIKNEVKENYHEVV